MIDKDEPALALAAYAIRSREQTLRRLYDTVVDLMNEFGIPPVQLAYDISEAVPGGYKTFTRMHKRLQAEDFSKVISISIAHLEPGPEYDYKRRDSEFWVSLNAARGTGLAWAIYARKLGLDEGHVVDRMLELAAIGDGDYGFIYFMKYRWMPVLYPMGLQSGDDEVKKEHPDLYSNRGWWGLRFGKEGFPVLLRDVFPLNLLTRPYLDLPVDKATLESWVGADATRGTLEPLAGNERITVWRVEPRHIPRVREELFKAGIVFYWRFFEAGDPLERDFSKLFTPPDPVPDIYRADFHVGRDPKVTR